MKLFIRFRSLTFAALAIVCISQSSCGLVSQNVGRLMQLPSKVIPGMGPQMMPMSENSEPESETENEPPGNAA